jgi:hypothetical protein
MGLTYTGARRSRWSQSRILSRRSHTDFGFVGSPLPKGHAQAGYSCDERFCTPGGPPCGDRSLAYQSNERRLVIVFASASAIDFFLKRFRPLSIPKIQKHQFVVVVVARTVAITILTQHLLLLPLLLAFSSILLASCVTLSLCILTTTITAIGFCI